MIPSTARRFRTPRAGGQSRSERDETVVRRPAGQLIDELDQLVAFGSVGPVEHESPLPPRGPDRLGGERDGLAGAEVVRCPPAQRLVIRREEKPVVGARDRRDLACERRVRQMPQEQRRVLRTRERSEGGKIAGGRRGSEDRSTA